MSAPLVVIDSVVPGQSATVERSTPQAATAALRRTSHLMELCRFLGTQIDVGMMLFLRHQNHMSPDAELPLVARVRLRRMRCLGLATSLFITIAILLQAWCTIHAWWLLTRGSPPSCERLHHWVLLYAISMVALAFFFTVVAPIVIWWTANGIVTRSVTPPECGEVNPHLWNFVDEALYLGLAVCCSLAIFSVLLIVLRRRLRALGSFLDGRGPALEEMTRALLAGPPAVVAPDTECAICFEECDNRARWRELPCHHQFHEQCLLDWFRYAHRCPLCRNNLNATFLDEQIGTETHEQSGNDANDIVPSRLTEMSRVV